MIKKVKNTAPWTYVISDFNGEKFFGTFYEKELQKINQKVFRVEKVRKKNGDKLYVKWKGKDSSFNCWIDKKRHSMSEYFPEPKSSGERVKVEIDLSIYATKSDFKNGTGVDISKFAKKTDLANLKSNLVPVPVDSSEIKNNANIKNIED